MPPACRGGELHAGPERRGDRYCRRSPHHCGGHRGKGRVFREHTACCASVCPGRAVHRSRPGRWPDRRFLEATLRTDLIQTQKWPRAGSTTMVNEMWSAITGSKGIAPGEVRISTRLRGAVRCSELAASVGLRPRICDVSDWGESFGTMYPSAFPVTSTSSPVTRTSALGPTCRPWKMNCTGSSVSSWPDGTLALSAASMRTLASRSEDAVAPIAPGTLNCDK